MTGPILRLLSRLVPHLHRDRWREEWQAELRHGGWRMLTGALPDAWAMRRYANEQNARARHAPLRGLLLDVRYATRRLVASPGFTLGVAVSLGVGMTGPTAAFSLLNAVVLRPPGAVERPDEVVRLEVTRVIDGFPFGYANYEVFRRLQSELQSFSGIAAHRASEMAVGFPGEPIQVPGMLVSSNYFDVLGVTPTLGRLLGPADAGASGSRPVAVLSHDAWVHYFSADASIVGSPIKVNGYLLEVVGVAPAAFTGVRRELDEDEGPDIWIPLAMSHLVVRDAQNAPAAIEDVASATLGLVGRLRPGITREAAQAEASVVGSTIEWKEPLRLGWNQGAPSVQLPAQVRLRGLGQAEGTVAELVTFMAVPMIVLTLACVNAASLLSGRASREIRGIAVRLSVGASGWRIVRQLLVESMILSLLGAGLGLAITYWSLGLVASYFPLTLPMDWRVTAFAVSLAVSTTVAFGLAPALSTARRGADLVQGMTRRPTTRVRAALIATQAALSLALMVTGGQFVNTVRARAHNDGLQAPDRLAIATIDVGKLPWQRGEVDLYFEQILDRVKQLPGVVHAAVSCACSPWGGWEARGGGGVRIWLAGQQPETPTRALGMYANGDLPGALELRLAAGRGFLPEEQRGRVRAIMVNQPFADRYLGGHGVGQLVQIGATDDAGASETATVVGIVQAPAATARNDRSPVVYYPAPLADITTRTIYVRFDRAAAESIPLLQTAIREVHADVPRTAIATAEALRWERHLSDQFLASWVSALGVLALLLAGGGLYGVVAFVVSMRRQEIAIRMALGARPGAVIQMIARQAVRPALFGAVVGASGAIVTGLIVRSRLYGASPVDALALGCAGTLLIAVLLTAAVFPARRAARVNPVDALRAE